MLHYVSDFRSDAAEHSSLAELMGAFSYALDLTEGQPDGHSLRACLIAVRIAQALDLGAEEQRVVYYATMLKDLGCSSNAARIAEIYIADDRVFKRDFKLVGDRLASMLGFVFTHTAKGGSPLSRGRAIVNILRNGPQIANGLIETRCTRGAEIARLLRFPEPVAAGIFALDEHWDGGGKPLGSKAEAIPLAARIALLAQVVDVFACHAGPDAACAEVSRLSGRWFDPVLTAVFARLAGDPEFWEEWRSHDLPAIVAALEPAGEEVVVDEDYIDDIVAAFGQVIDAKSPYTAGHSERVGEYCDAVAARMGLPPAERRRLRRAAVLHDIGKLGVSCSVLEKPASLDRDEWAVMQQHAAHTGQILGRVGPLRKLAAVASAHHERLDGTGYPSRLSGDEISLETRIISVCDFYDALTADRPYRKAMSPRDALAIMEKEAGKAIDPACLTALRDAVQVPDPARIKMELDIRSSA